MTNTHLNGSKPYKQSAGSGRVTLSCWRWCFTLCKMSLIILGYWRESGPGAALCQWVTSSEQGEWPLMRHSKIPAWCLIHSWPYFDPISPCNTHSHKQHASDLPAEESQKPRKIQWGVAICYDLLLSHLIDYGLLFHFRIVTRLCALSTTSSPCHRFPLS